MRRVARRQRWEQWSNSRLSAKNLTQLWQRSGVPVSAGFSDILSYTPPSLIQIGFPKSIANRQFRWVHEPSSHHYYYITESQTRRWHGYSFPSRLRLETPEDISMSGAYQWWATRLRAPRSRGSQALMCNRVSEPCAASKELCHVLHMHQIQS